MSNWYFGYQVWVSEWGPVYCQVWGPEGDQVWGPLWEPVLNQAWVQVRDPVYSDLKEIYNERSSGPDDYYG